jgi:hypothetical protein
MNRAALNKLLLISAGLTVLSGIYLLFHYISPFTKAMHEVSGIVMALLSMWHLKLYWRALINSSGGKKFFNLVLLLFVIIVVVMSVTGQKMTRDEIIKKFLQDSVQAIQ